MAFGSINSPIFRDLIKDWKSELLRSAKDLLQPSLEENAAERKFVSSLSVKETKVSVFSISKAL